MPGDNRGPQWLGVRERPASFVLLQVREYLTAAMGFQAGCGEDGWCDVEPGCDAAKDVNAELLYNGWDKCVFSETTQRKFTADKLYAASLDFAAGNKTGAGVPATARANDWMGTIKNQETALGAENMSAQGPLRNLPRAERGLILLQGAVQRQFMGHHRILDAHRHELSEFLYLCHM